MCVCVAVANLRNSIINPVHLWELLSAPDGEAVTLEAPACSARLGILNN